MTRMSEQLGSTAEIMAAIRDFILNELLQRSDLELTQDTPLIEDGYLTSLQAVELVLYLEERFQIEIPPEEVNEAEFRSLRTLTSLVQRKIEGSA